MKGFLNRNKIDYVIFHLRHHYDIPDEIMRKFVFLNIGEKASEHKDSIIFQLTDNDLYVKEFRGIPVIFCDEKYETLAEEIDTNLVFRHDIFKSIFYLLSGYQEYADSRRDKLGRFSYHFSIQKKYDFVLKPLVNYYFEILTDAINNWLQGKRNKIKSRPLPFKDFGFCLSHDVDRIDKYTLNYILYKIKEVTGMVASALTRSQNFTELFKALYYWINPFSTQNPYWNFDFLLETEEKLKIQATYFFLHRGVRHVDSSYSFNDKRLVKLYKVLNDRGHEIGIHGSSESIVNTELASSHLEELKKISAFPVSSCRQHRLLFEHSESTRVQLAAGLEVDCTLGFFDYPGFRNSYCFPFRLYDFERDQMTTLWEIPLIVMDCTLLDYCSLSYEESLKIIGRLLDEIRKFGGVFSLLWHNNYFDETLHPGITEFYSRLLDTIQTFNPEKITPKGILKRYSNRLTFSG